MFRKEIKISFLPCSAFSSFQAEWILHHKPGISGIYSNSLQLAKALQVPRCNKRLQTQEEAKEQSTLASLKFSSNKTQCAFKKAIHRVVCKYVCSFLLAQSSLSAKPNYFSIFLFTELHHIYPLSIYHHDLLVPSSSFSSNPGCSRPLTSAPTLRRD